jgi:hypothetical protein
VRLSSAIPSLASAPPEERKRARWRGATGIWRRSRSSPCRRATHSGYRGASSAPPPDNPTPGRRRAGLLRMRTRRTPGMRSRSRCCAYPGTSRSKRTTTSWFPRASARINPRHSVACPLPRDELNVSPRMTGFQPARSGVPEERRGHARRDARKSEVLRRVGKRLAAAPARSSIPPTACGRPRPAVGGCCPPPVRSRSSRSAARRTTSPGCGACAWRSWSSFGPAVTSADQKPC